MTDRENQQRLDRLSMHYLAAVDAADFDAVAAIWEQAETDPGLAEALHALNAALGDDTYYAAAETVTVAAEQHLTSAEVERPADGPVTVADVAAELFRHPPARLAADAHEINERLRATADALPDDLALPKLIAWAEARYGVAPTGYWDAFRDAALLVLLRRDAAVEYQLAARRAKPGGKSS